MTIRRARFIANGLNGKWCSRASACWLVALAALAGCSSTGGTGEPDGSIRGELQIYRVDYLDGHSERQFYLASDAEGAQKTRLAFASDPGLQPWTKLKVWGTETAAGLRVERYQEQTDAASEDVQESAQALSKPTKKTRTVGFVLMDVGDGVNLSTADATAAIFGTRTPTQAGLNQFYNENSYGGFNFTGDILGPKTVTNLGTCQQSAIDMIEGAWPTTFNKDYDHWMQYIGSDYMSCDWGGIGGEGTAARPASGSWYNAGTYCTVLNQEVGHNLGLMHSNSISCGSAPFADDAQSCTGAEYGDHHTVMGSGCAHLGAYEKWYEGFFGGCNAVRATASGTYTLLPTELPCDGVQALQIPMPKKRPFHNTSGTPTVVNLSKYYLELRTKTGIDAKEPGPAVLVTVSGDVPASNRTSEFTWVLDMDPTSTRSAEGLTAGKSFTDPAGGVSFTVEDVDATHATVNVTIASSTGPATCMDGTAFNGPGPQSCGATGPVGSGGSAGAAAGGSAGTSGSANLAGSGGLGGSSAASAGAGGSNPAGAGSAGVSLGGGASFAGGAGVGGSGGALAAAGSSAAGAAPGGASGNVAGSANHAPASAADASGCSCRSAPSSSPRPALASLALLALGYAFRRRRARSARGRGSWALLGVSLSASLLGCASKSEAADGQPAASSAAPAESGACLKRAEGVSAGLSKLSSGGYSFTLTALEPSEPVQSSGDPGNTWSLSIADASGAPVTGATLQISSFMPDHGHYAPTAVALEQGGGTYRVEDLILPMPGLYAITATLTTAGGQKESAAFSLCLSTSS